MSDALATLAWGDYVRAHPNIEDSAHKNFLAGWEARKIEVDDLKAEVKLMNTWLKYFDAKMPALRDRLDRVLSMATVDDAETWAAHRELIRSLLSEKP